jgi:hypothetical protein
MGLTMTRYYATDIDRDGDDTSLAPVAGHRWK